MFFILGSFWPWRGEIRATFVVDNEVEKITLVTKQEKFDKEQVIDIEVSDDLDVTIEKIKKINLENAINLDVPFTSQAPEKNWDQPWQDACEEAAIIMLEAYYKEYDLSPLFVKDEILKMTEWESEQGWGSSINANKVKQLAEWYIDAGHNLKIINNPTIDGIKKLVSSGKPVLVLADGKALPNPYFSNGGPVYHALIIRGYTDEKFITNDPGTQFGENFTYTYSDLMSAIHDWNGGDVSEGQPVVLVLE